MRPVPQSLFPAVLAALVLAAPAAGAPQAGGPGSPGPQTVSVAPVAAVHLAPRGAAEARVSVTVAEGFHIQANPAAADYLIATRLAVKASPGIKAGKPVYPKGKPYQLQGSDDKMSIYDGTFEIVVPLRAAAVAPPGERTLRATLRFQACDDRACYAPVSVPVEIPIQVAAPR
ncbi:MAG TPA: protein-disulfide reductase DsbD domain-containing protein [Candidatus Saccharimonadales bacterium]|nr:protein-disulfide reductase DsbD domain-containing protein [Candidatus Saccharimonadales bacterium]